MRVKNKLSLFNSYQLSSSFDQPLSLTTFCFICRQKALKALNERMSKLEQPASWPSLDDPAEDKTSEDIEVIEEPDVVVVEHKDLKVDSVGTTTVEVT